MAASAGMAAVTNAFLPKAIGAVLDSVATRSKRTASRRLLEAMGPMRRRVMQTLWVLLKDNADKDPDLPRFARAQVFAAIDAIAADVELQTEEMLKLGSNHDGPGDLQVMLPLSPKLGNPCCSRLRAFILHHLFPQNRTMWGCLRDPIWWMLCAPLFVTVWSVRIVAFLALLLLLVCPGPPDEFQLAHFIILLKSNQWLTAGLGCITLGCVEYYYCILFEKSELLQCINRTTGGSVALWFCLVDYLASFIVPRLAMFAFKWARRISPCSVSPLGHSLKPLPKEMLSCGCCFVEAVSPRRLRMLMRYDAGCFILSFALMLLLTFLSLRQATEDLVCDPTWIHRCTVPTLEMNAYWCKVLYALLMIPFVGAWLQDFTTGSFSVITRASRTGYDKEGRCVLFKVTNESRRARHARRRPTAATTRLARNPGESDDDILSSVSTSSGWSSSEEESFGGEPSLTNATISTASSSQGASDASWWNWRYIC